MLYCILFHFYAAVFDFWVNCNCTATRPDKLKPPYKFEIIFQTVIKSAQLSLN